MLLPQNRMFRLPEVSMLSRPSLNAFTDDFAHLDAQLSCVLFGVSKKEQIASSKCLKETDKLDLGKTRDQLVDLRTFAWGLHVNPRAGGMGGY